jgi:hypothetical protein
VTVAELARWCQEFEFSQGSIRRQEAELERKRLEDECARNAVTEGKCIMQADTHAAVLAFQAARRRHECAEAVQVARRAE